jgi:uncharacterized phage-associated protein
MSYPAITVANTIIKKAIDLKIPDLTHLKLQKLAYLAHGWTLAIKNEPLITEEFHAWQYGPVVPILYSYFCKFGNKTINELALMSIDNPDKDIPIRYLYVEPVIEDDKEINDIIDKVIKKYGPWTAGQLVNKTHAENGPWYITLKRKQEIIYNDLIKEDMLRLAEAINQCTK